MTAEVEPWAWKCSCGGDASYSPSWYCSKCKSFAWSDEKTCKVCPDQKRLSLFREHHCRACGHTICGAHSVTARLVAGRDKLEVAEVRVCTLCASRPAESNSCRIRIRLLEIEEEFFISKHRLFSLTNTKLPLIIPLLDIKDARRADAASRLLLTSDRFPSEGLKLEFETEGAARSTLQVIAPHSGPSKLKAKPKQLVRAPADSRWEADLELALGEIARTSNGVIYRRYSIPSELSVGFDDWFSARSDILATVFAQPVALMPIEVGYYEGHHYLAVVEHRDKDEEYIPLSQLVQDMSQEQRLQFSDDLIAYAAVLAASVALLHENKFSRIGLGPRSLVVDRRGRPRILIRAGIEFEQIVLVDGITSSESKPYLVESSLFAHPTHSDPLGDDWYAVGCYLWLCVTGAFPQQQSIYEAPEEVSLGGLDFSHEETTRRSILGDALDIDPQLATRGQDFWANLFHCNFKHRQMMWKEYRSWSIFNNVDWNAALAGRWPFGRDKDWRSLSQPQLARREARRADPSETPFDGPLFTF